MSEHFENRVKDILGNFELEPNEEVWQHVRTGINRPKPKRRFLFWWMIPFGIASIGMLYYITSDNKRRYTETSLTEDTGQISSTATHSIDQAEFKGSKEGAGADTVISNNRNDLLVKKHPTTGQSTSNAIPVSGIKSRSSLKRFTPNLKDGDNDGDLATSPVAATEQKGVPKTEAPVAIFNDEPSDSLTMVKTASPGDKDSLISNVEDSNTLPVQRKKAKQWRFGIITEVGMSVLNAAEHSPRYLLSNASFQNATSAGSASSPIIKDGIKSNPSITYHVGFVAARDVSSRLSLLASVGYLHQSFLVSSNKMKDSANLRTQLAASTNSYKTNYLNFSFGTAWYFTSNKLSRYGLSARIDNLILVHAQQKTVTTMLQSNAFIPVQRVTTISGYNKWQPSLNIGIPATFTLKNGASFQLTPFMRYGLKPLHHDTNGNIFSAGLSTVYSF